MQRARWTCKAIRSSLPSCWSSRGTSAGMRRRRCPASSAISRPTASRVRRGRSPHGIWTPRNVSLRRSPTTLPTRRSSSRAVPNSTRSANRSLRSATPSRVWTSASSGLARLARLACIFFIGLRYRLHDLAAVPGGTRGVRLRQALETLGPISVKFGQVLSTRRDLVPLDIADELAKLQDQVPPFASELAVAEVERSLGEPVSVLFAEFDKTPVASASIAQVHLARLHDETEVAVKVLR